ncbi:LPXTG-motif cell wall anchor domain-containing protein [Enterobacter sp. kpr-6]|uniref:hypothetical protein n=1 Tax=Enterobacter sp. kpr-6 TaxID=1761782 RepID=UPI0008E994F5|nr:hypothetical protein [Enterobacter sp. kpr-6]SFR00649.1 LPXTG-motif cell wall anchor domain-containing protein [Enterobacter sp. kpr-6]
MKNAGWLLSVSGVILALYALFFMDVSVPVGDGTRVNNIGLLAQQQNLIVIAGVLFIAGVLISALRKRKSVPDIDYSPINNMTGEFVLNKTENGQYLDLNSIDKLSLMLLKKHGRSSVNEILLMNGPMLDRMEGTIPEDLRKDFRRKLTERLKENS